MVKVSYSVSHDFLPPLAANILTGTLKTSHQRATVYVNLVLLALHILCMHGLLTQHTVAFRRWCMNGSLNTCANLYMYMSFSARLPVSVLCRPEAVRMYVHT